jgi:hypothetical protein
MITRLSSIGLLVVLLVSAVSTMSQTMFRKVNDFDGDGRADFAVTRNVGGLKIWYILQTTAGFRQVHWGVDGTDVNTPGDYDGDGKTDLAIMRRSFTPNTCDFHIRRSGDSAYEIRSLNVFFESACGASHQDYDGDGKTDVANKEQGVTGFVTYQLTTGGSGSFESPVFDPGVRVGDVDGDGKAEFASVNNSTRRVTFRNLVTGGVFVQTFGLTGDIFAPADFDGDGIGDLTIFRPSTGDWWWIRSSDSVVNVVHWGAQGDLPVPADYDNDGKTDQGVYRPSTPNGIYYINGSATGFQGFAWGIPGDSLIRY